MATDAKDRMECRPSRGPSVSMSVTMYPVLTTSSCHPGAVIAPP